MRHFVSVLPGCLGLLGVFLVAPLGMSNAAEAADDTFLRDYAETRGFMLGRPVNATPTPDGSAVLFLRAKGPRDPSQEIYEYDVVGKQTRRLLSPDEALKGAVEELSPEEKARRERQRISVGGFTAFSISKDSALVLLSLSGKIYVLHRADSKVTELATGEGITVDPKFSPDNKSVAYVRNQDVCVFDLASGKEYAVTTGGTEVLSHGLAEFVAQEEMSRFSGYWWSPDSRQIAYQETDVSKVESWYVSDPAQPGNVPTRFFYPRPGKENASVRLGVAAATGEGKTTWIDWDHAHYPYLGKVTWMKDGPLSLTVLSRDQTDLALLTVNPSTGGTHVLLTEHDAAWVNLNQDVPYWLPDGKGFVWHGGDNALYFYGAKGEPGGGWGKNLRNLSGVVGDLAYGVFSDQSPAHAEATADNLFTTAFTPWVLPSRSLGLEQMNFGDCEKIFVLTNQTLDHMPQATVRRADNGAIIGELPSVALAPPFVPKTTLDDLSTVLPLYPGKEGCTSMVVHPRDFDPASKRKYPVIVDVYGGPGHQEVVASMHPYLLDQWLADQGFIVVASDGRGTPYRDHDWEHAIAGHFGSVPLDDQVAALKSLGAKYPEMDMDRVGITGWSFGGYMSALAVMRRPDVFKAAVAGAPVVDWMDYDTCYTERYLGVPGAGRFPGAYKEGSLLTYAADLQRPLLLIHGTADDNVYFRHSLRLAEALFRAGKPFDFLPLSGFTHMVPDSVVRARLQERIVKYFKDHL